MEVQHIQGFNKADAVAAGQLLRGDPTHLGIHMDGINELNIRILVHNPANGAEHLVHGLTQILPAVSREQDQTAASRPLQIFLGIVLGHRGAQSINGGVAGDKNVAGILPLPQQVLPGVLSRCKVVAGDDAHRLAVKLLRIGGIQVVGPQAGLHMPHGDAQVEAGQGRGEGGGGIPVDQDHIRLFPLQHRGELLQNCLSDVKERLPLLHNRQVIIRLHTEGAHHLLQHRFMLPGGADHGSKLRPAFQLVDQGAHFDGFGSGTKYQE